MSITEKFDKYIIRDRLLEIRNGIPRFISDENYSSGNFSRLRDEHAKLQLDSENGTDHRKRTILSRTNWPPEFFEGKVILECGCGAGADTEILVSLGAQVVSVDLAGVDVAQENLHHNPNVQFIQADITDLPLRKQSFDIVYCHRVLQHTPHPEETLSHILEFVKDDGAVFVHSYARSRYQMWNWKYWLRPITTRLAPEMLYKIIKFYSVPAYYITNLINRWSFGKSFSHYFIPFMNHRYDNKVFRNKSRDYIIEYGVHDTFDALSPRYDDPVRPQRMQEIASAMLKRPFEVVELQGMTLLRTKVIVS